MAAKKRGKAARVAATQRAPAVKRAARTSKKAKQVKAVKRSASPARPASKAAPSKVKKASPRASKATEAAPAPVAANGPATGDPAPEFELTDHAGEQLSSADLAGSPYVIYFYPKDDTPGCTLEACGFRDAAAEFEEIGVRVIGVSPDSVSSHQRFSTKYGLPFSLLSDEGKRLASAYGVWSLKKNYGREYMGVVRSTFLVDGSGLIRNAWRGVRVKGHVDEVQAAARALS